MLGHYDKTTTMDEGRELAIENLIVSTSSIMDNLEVSEINWIDIHDYPETITFTLGDETVTKPIQCMKKRPVLRW